MIRIIKFEVASDGISPATLQDAGIQGEDRATELKFKLSDELYSSLVEGGGTLFYRFDIETSTGLTLSLTSNNLEGKDISLPLVRVLTRDGGTARVTLIITSVSKDFTTESEVYSHACHIRFDNKRDSTTEEEYESLTTIEQSAKASAGRAETAAAETVKAAAETKAAQRLLEEGTSFIFNGNGMNAPLIVDDTMDNGSDNHPATKGAIKKFVNDSVEAAKITIDDKMAENSENPVQNGVIKRYIDGKVGAEYILSLSNPCGTLIFEDGEEDSDYYAEEIGSGNNRYSLYLYHGTNAQVKLPGVWEKIQGRIIIGSSGDFELGTTGGEAEIQLTVDQLPAHTHSGKTEISGNHTHSSGWTHSTVGSGGRKYGHDLDGTTLYAGVNQLGISAAGAHTHFFTTYEAGKGEKFNIMNPFIVYNIWHRIKEEI